MKIIRIFFVLFLVSTCLTSSSFTFYPQSRGLAAYCNPGDFNILDAGWYYTWSQYPCSGATQEFVPMSRCGEMINLSPTYDKYILVFNEPGNPNPNYGCTGLDIPTSASRYIALKNTFPKAKLIVGGVFAWDSTGWFYNSNHWLVDFINYLYTNNIPFPHGYHVHGYIEGYLIPSSLFEMWEIQHNITHSYGQNPEFWITEFADTYGNPNNLNSMIDWIVSRRWVDRYAYFINRAQGNEAWYPPGWNVQLVDWNTGQLTQLGQVYKQTRLGFFTFLSGLFKDYSATPTPKAYPAPK